MQKCFEDKNPQRIYRCANLFQLSPCSVTCFYSLEPKSVGAQLYCVEIEGFEPSSSHFASYTLKLFVNVLMISKNIRFKAIYVRSKTFIYMCWLAIPTRVYARLERIFQSYILYGDTTDSKILVCRIFLSFLIHHIVISYALRISLLILRFYI